MRFRRIVTPTLGASGGGKQTVWRPFTRFWPEQRAGKFGLDRFKSRLQALVDGHEFETLNPFASQYEGRQMKGIQRSQ